MAESKLAKLEEIFRCSVCLETYSFPKTLKCQHSFCMSCLAKIVRSTLVTDIGVLNPAKAITIDCPLCKTEQGNITALNDLPANFTIVQALDVVQERQGDATALSFLRCCSFCRYSVAISICITCQTMRCFRCYLYLDCGDDDEARHVNFPINSQNGDEYRCEEHNLIREYYCTVCDVPICLDCFLTTHREHKTKIISSVKKEVEEILGKLKVVSTKNLVEGIHAWNDACSRIKQIDGNEAELLQDIKQHHVKLQKIFETLFEKINAFCHEEFAKERQILLDRFTTEDALQANSDRIENLMSFVDSKMSNDVLVACQSSVLKEVLSSCEEKSIKLKDAKEDLKLPAMPKKATVEIDEEEFKKSMVKMFENMTLRFPNGNRKTNLTRTLENQFKALFPPKKPPMQTADGARARESREASGWELIYAENLITEDKRLLAEEVL